MLTNDKTLKRRLALEGTYNVRDLGGYATSDGHHMRWHTLIRADKLDRITPAGQHALIDYGVRTIIDLRYTPEVEAEPDVFATSKAVRYHHMPLYELSGHGTLPVVPDDLEELYRLLLDYRKEQIRSILSLLAEPTTLPTLVHCTAGKDRTGLVVALVLGAVGVAYETIIEDYALSGRYLTDLNEELRVTARNNGYDADWYDRLLLCQPDIMRHTLQYLDQHYGDIPGYLLHTGLTHEQLDQLRWSLVE